MKNRRYFLIQASLAATAMFALKPLTTIAGTCSRFTGFSGSYGKLAFLHTTNLHPFNDYRLIQHIKDIKNNGANAILLNAGQDVQDETGTLTYDVSINEANELSAITGDYKIINKGKLITGIISAQPAESGIFEKINALSTYLKKEKNCTIVVCLSRLGYKNTNAPDDITLAKKSTHLDIIIGGHADNFHAYPIIALNSNNGEVIIHSSAGDPATFGKIEIDFDGQEQKNHIRFSNKLFK